MEFSMLGTPEGLVSSDQKCCGSAGGFLKQDNGDDFRASKVGKFRDDDSISTSSLKASSFVNFSYDGQQELNMLSFSSPKMEDFSLQCSASGGFETKNLQKSAFPSYFQHPSSTNYSKISGYSYTGGGGVNNRSMYFLNGVKGSFTPAQWIELEQQALIYKYIIANEPIPPNLLIPIRRALESDGFFGFPAGLFTPNSFGWGGFHLGLFSNSSDPEPGRCRRTDGKKWRCSREAVPDQKYCERHINRGRHRSRKPVEGQNRSGHSVSGRTTPTTKVTNSSPNIINVAPPSSSAPVPRASASNSFASDQATSSLINRLLMNKQNSSQGMQDSTGLDFLSPTINLNSSANTFTTPKDNHNPFAESSTPIGNFGLLTSDPLYKAYPSPHDLNDFMSSSTSSPTGEGVTKLSSTPMRLLSGELDMGLGVGSQKQQSNSNWLPISWEPSMGGPLGEALKTSSNNSESLQPGGCASSSPRGVLQQTPLVSLSNSSAGSSPRAENGREPDCGMF